MKFWKLCNRVPKRLLQGDEKWLFKFPSFCFLCITTFSLSTWIILQFFKVADVLKASTVCFEDKIRKVWGVQEIPPTFNLSVYGFPQHLQWPTHLSAGSSCQGAAGSLGMASWDAQPLSHRSSHRYAYSLLIRKGWPASLVFLFQFASICHQPVTLIHQSLPFF